MAVVALATSVVLLTNLGSPPLWDDDEPKNTACSVSMLAGGDWVVPRFNESLRTDKPPLVNWIQLAGFAGFGVNEFGARFGSAMLTIGTSLLTAGIATRLLPSLPAIALWSGLAVGTCAWTAVAGRAATPDAGLCFFTTLAAWIFTGSTIPAGRSGDRVAAGLVTSLGVGAALGGAVLAKGPVGVIVPLAALGLFAWWEAFAAASPGGGRPVADMAARAARGVVAAWKGVRPLTVVAAAIAVAGPWYALVWHRTGGEWVRGFLIEHNVGRFSAPMEGHGGPPFYYVLALVVGLFPWSIVAGLTAAHLLAGSRRGSDASPLRLLASWIIVWVGCFSVSGTKLPGYIWPAYPAAAIATGWLLERWRLGLTASDRWMRVAWGVLGLCGSALAVGLTIACRPFGEACLWLSIPGILLAAASVLAWRSQSHGERGAALGWLATAGCLAVALLAALGPDLVGRSTGVRPLVAAVGNAAGPAAESGDDWGSYRCGVPGLVFYSGAAERGREVPRLATAEEAREFFTDHPRGFLVAPAAHGEEVLAAAPAGHAVLGRSQSLTSLRELVVIGPATGRSRGSMANRFEEGSRSR